MPEDHHVCPVWVGYLLASPVRKLLQNPDKLLAPYVCDGMTVLDVGSAMGFFSIPMARMVSPGGKVICVDLQQKMLDVLMKRARKAGVADRIIQHKCSSNTLGLDEYAGTVDFALASAVVHESPTPVKFVHEICEALKPGGVLVITEPSGHVTAEMFGKTVGAARESGMKVIKQKQFRWYYQGVFEKI